MLRLGMHAGVIVLLTLLTQIGGATYGLALWLRPRFSWASTSLGLAGLFVALYAVAWLPIGQIAALGGRKPLPCVERAGLSASVVSCVLHRNYVTPELFDVLTALAEDVARRYPGAKTRALDANFPFFDGVPLPPHLSHDDGEKVDLAFHYARRGAPAPGMLASPIGYWRFEQPRQGEPLPCGTRSQGWRWNMEWFAPFTRRDLVLDEERTRYVLRWLAHTGAERGIGKVFVEPHLAQRLGVSGDVIRFQGCRAARHDDHIHVQLR
ncbi:MAG: hypothetical protein NT015_11145 [Alphaproteobacteria bacterium]|nr:hypothetical protein [Alphaproteobacteria bacterium]